MSCDIKTEQLDLDALCICAVRYCQGRETYMPGLIREIVIRYLDRLSDKAVNALLLDAKAQADCGMYGNDRIDKPGWLEFKRKLEEEKRRRESSGE